jgi:hypothetical protein
MGCDIEMLAKLLSCVAEGLSAGEVMPGVIIEERIDDVSLDLATIPSS